MVPLWRLGEYWATRQYDRMVIDCSGPDGYAPALARALVAYAAEHARMRKNPLRRCVKVWKMRRVDQVPGCLGISIGTGGLRGI